MFQERQESSFFIAKKISKLQALTIVLTISFSLAKEEKVTKDKSGLFKATLVFSVFKLGQKIPSPAFSQLYDSSKIGLLLRHSHIELRLS